MQFQGNNSKRWDGKETWVEASILDELYDQAELVHGAEITVPWKSKGKITQWKGIFIDPDAQTSGRYKVQASMTSLAKTVATNTHFKST